MVASLTISADASSVETPRTIAVSLGATPATVAPPMPDMETLNWSTDDRADARRACALHRKVERQAPHLVDSEAAGTVEHGAVSSWVPMLISTGPLASPGKPPHDERLLRTTSVRPWTSIVTEVERRARSAGDRERRHSGRQADLERAVDANAVEAADPEIAGGRIGRGRDTSQKGDDGDDDAHGPHLHPLMVNIVLTREGLTAAALTNNERRPSHAWRCCTWRRR